jgi:hypothetical protein
MPRLKGLDTTLELTRYASALRAQHGFDFALRYYSDNAAKNLSLGEARALSAAGMQIGVVWETRGTYPGYFTTAQGVSDGSAAFRMAHEVVKQPFGSAIYFAVDYDASQADLDGPVSKYFTGVHAGLFAAGGGQPSYQVGVYGSGMSCRTLRERDAAAFSWLSQSTGFAGSRDYARNLQYDLIQFMPQRVQVDGFELLVDPDETHPDRPAGLFQV